MTIRENVSGQRSCECVEVHNALQRQEATALIGFTQIIIQPHDCQASVMFVLWSHHHLPQSYGGGCDREDWLLSFDQNLDLESHLRSFSMDFEMVPPCCGNVVSSSFVRSRYSPSRTHTAGCSCTAILASEKKRHHTTCMDQ